MYAFINWSIVLCWFIFLSFLITTKGVIERIRQFKIYINRVMSGAFMLLGIKLLFV